MLNRIQQLAKGDRWSQRIAFQRIFSCNIDCNGKLFGWILLPNDRAISWNVEPEEGETIAFEFGPFVITRPETDQEKEDREIGEAELAWEQQFADRWTY
jgi:hypothetical protein